MKSKEQNDVILYHHNEIYGLDKAKIQGNQRISEAMSPRDTEKVKSEVINPQDELDKISKKLSAKEKFILKTYLCQ